MKFAVLREKKYNTYGVYLSKKIRADFFLVMPLSVLFIYRVFIVMEKNYI